MFSTIQRSRRIVGKKKKENKEGERESFSWQNIEVSEIFRTISIQEIRRK